MVAPAPVSLNARDVLSILWRRSWIVLVVMSLSLALTWYVSKRTHPRWKATAQLLLIQRTLPSAAPPGTNIPGQVVELVDTQVALLQSYELAHRTVKDLETDALKQGKPASSVNITEEALQKQLTVNALPNTNLLEVNVEAESRSRATQLAEALCNTFVNYKNRVNKENSRETIADMQIRVKNAREGMIKADRAETDFKRKNQMADVSVQISTSVKQLAESQNEIDSLKPQLAAQKTKVAKLKQQLDKINTVIKAGGNVRNDLEVAELQSQLSKLEIERKAQEDKYTPNFPGAFEEIDTKITEIKNCLRIAKESIAKGESPSLGVQDLLNKDYAAAQLLLYELQSRYNEAVQIHDIRQKAIKNLPQKSAEYARLLSDANSARALYDLVLQSLNALTLDKDKTSGNVEITQHAHAPEKPFIPNTSRDLAFGGSIGFFLSLVGMLLLEQSDHRVRRLDQVRRLVPGPIVGALPQLTPWQVRAMLAGENTAQVEETYGLARANLGIVLRQKKTGDPWNHTLVLVTSALPGEGKSVTSAQLARSLARSGRSVILVDGDMRRPTQNRLFNMEPDAGLAECLVGHKRIDEVLIPSDTPNLLLLPSGKPLRNPTELLSLPSLPVLLDELRERADVIVFDTPACAGVADALFIAPYVDCILHVIRTGKADTDTVQETISSLQAANPDCMVFFVNSAPRERNTAYTAYKYYQSYNPNKTGKGEKTPPSLPIPLPETDTVRTASRNGHTQSNGAGHSDTIDLNTDLNTDLSGVSGMLPEAEPDIASSDLHEVNKI